MSNDPFLDWVKQTFPEVEIEGNIVHMPPGTLPPLTYRDLLWERVLDVVYPLIGPCPPYYVPDRSQPTSELDERRTDKFETLLTELRGKFEASIDAVPEIAKLLDVDLPDEFVGEISY